MAWTPTDYIAAFDAEAGDISSLATDALKVSWFNQAQPRLLYYKAKTAALEWDEGDLSVDLPADFVQQDKLDFGESVTIEPWRVFGLTLVTDDPTGASGDGTATLYYWAFWPNMVLEEEGGQ